MRKHPCNQRATDVFEALLLGFEQERAVDSLPRKERFLEDFRNHAKSFPALTETLWCFYKSLCRSAAGNWKAAMSLNLRARSLLESVWPRFKSRLSCADLPLRILQQAISLRVGLADYERSETPEQERLRAEAERYGVASRLRRQ